MNALSPSRIDWTQVERIIAQARRDRAEAAYRILVAPLAAAVRRTRRARSRSAPALAG